MTAAVIALAVALAGALSLIGWLAYVALGARSATADEREDHVATRGELERVKFEREVIAGRLADTERMATALQEVLADAQTNPNADLDRADVTARLRRAAQAATVGGAIPARTDAAVPGTAATVPPRGALMPLDDT